MSGESPAQLMSPDDLGFLKEKEHQYTVEQVNGMIHLLISEYMLPDAYSPTAVDLLLRLPPNFPVVAPDMFWMHPEVRLRNGAHPAAADHFETFGGRNWQRWSRHFTQAWRPGSDDLRTFMGSIRRELTKGI